MNEIFVSYRRSDSSAIVGRIIDRLENRFGREKIFRDLSSIRYGQDFGKVIGDALAQCKVCLVIIGDDWINVRNDAGNRRIDDSNDWVRTEVVSALEQGVRVIPVLVEDAIMPEKSQLPENLKNLAGLNAAKVRDDPDFDVDVDRLFNAVDSYLSDSPKNSNASFTKRRRIVLAGFALCFAVVAAVYRSDLVRVMEDLRIGTADGYQLELKGVELFPPSDSASVKVSAYVNGTKFTYPSIGGVEWLQVAPTMSSQTFRLPKAEQYEVRFEMLKREQGASETAKLLSQETVSFAVGSLDGRYSLYGFDPASRTRSGRISAEIIYSIRPAR